MTTSKALCGRAAMVLRRESRHEPWVLHWPKQAQDAAFTSLTHDELMRLGLLDKLDERIKRRPPGTGWPMVLRVTLTIKESMPGQKADTATP